MTSISNTLTELGHPHCYHITPLHYLPFIARTRKLLSKELLRKCGFSETHFRSSSRRTDDQRGFGRVVHTTICQYPPILESKLRLGLPHIELVIPTADFPEDHYALCRYNIAKNRGLFRESDADGHLYHPFMVPVAMSESEKRAMLVLHGMGCLEVLFFDQVPLPSKTYVRTFHNSDTELAQMVLKAFGSEWRILQEKPRMSYPRRQSYQALTEDFVARALQGPTWTGFPIEFDR